MLSLNITLLSAELLVTEIHYNSGRVNNNDSNSPQPDGFEFLEFFNAGNQEINLSSFTFARGLGFSFPTGAKIGPGKFIVLSKDPEQFSKAYGFEPDFGPFLGKLNNSGERITLVDNFGEEVWDGSYSDRGDWPAQADGAGYSLVYEDHNDSHLRGRNWEASNQIGGSPGNWDNLNLSDEDEIILLQKGDNLKYFKGTKEPSNGDTSWTKIGFAESSSWLNAKSGVGYSNNNQERNYLATMLPDMRDNYLSVYTRFPFLVTEAQINSIDQFNLNLAYDDGYVVYLNGVKITSANISGSPPPFNRPASTGSDYSPVNIDLLRYSNRLQPGENILAIQGHNVGIGVSSDFVISPTLTLKTKMESNKDEAWEGVIFNEVFANSAQDMDFVELFNPSNEQINLSGYYLSDSAFGPRKYKIPENTIIEPKGFIHFTRAELGFGLSSNGEKIILYRPDQEIVVDAYGWGKQLPETSLVRIPDGGKNWFHTSKLTPGQQNSKTSVYPVALNEIMYHHPDGERFEYLEIFNPSQELPIDISGWHFVGLSYKFPKGTIIHPEEYVVVCDDKVSATQFYNIPLEKLFGDYSGGLRDNGELLILQDENDIVVDLVRFDNKSPWPWTPNGLGASLERTCIKEGESDYSHWSGSPINSPSPGKENQIVGCVPAIRPKIQITEIHYHSSIQREDDRNLEFLELWNFSSEPIDLANWILAGDIHYTFPNQAIIEPEQKKLVAFNPDRLIEEFDLEPKLVFGPFSGGLPNGGGSLALIATDGQIVDQVNYNDDFPWPSLADGIGSVRGPGHSLQRVNDRSEKNTADFWYTERPSPGEKNMIPGQEWLNPIMSLNLSPETVTSSSEPILAISLSESYNVISVEVEYFIEDFLNNKETKSRSTATKLESGDWQFQFPQYPPNSVVRYVIYSQLDDGSTITTPNSNRDQFKWHSYFVDPEITTSQPNLYHLFISPLNWRKLHSWTDAGRVSGGKPNPTWNNEVPAIFVGGGEVFDVSVRHQGSRWNRRNGSLISFECGSHRTDGRAQVRSWRIQFPNHRRFRGMDVMLLQKQSGWPQRISFAMFEMAGVPAPKTSWANLRINGCEYNPDAFQIERPGNDLVKRWFGQVGDLFKSQGYTGNEGPWSWGDARLIRGSMNGFSETQRYKFTYNRKTLNYKSNELDNAPDLPEALIEGLHRARSKGRNALREFLASNFDVNLTLRYMCTINYVGTFDDMFQNHYIYRRADNGLWCMFPWDMDNTLGGAFGQSSAHPFRGVDESRYGNVGNRQGWWNRIKDSFFIAYPEEFLRMFYYLNNNVYNPESLDVVIDQIAEEGNQTGRALSLKSHIRARHNYLNNFIENQLSRMTPDLTIENLGTRLKIQWPGSGLFSNISGSKSINGPWRPITENVTFDGEHFKILLRPNEQSGFFKLSE